MSYTKKSKDLRSIIVNDIKYRWRFSSGEMQSSLVVYGPISSRQKLSVALLEWRDEWLACPEPTNNDPKIIGPGFVRQAIEFGLTNGWHPETADSVIQLEWSNSQFATIFSSQSD